MAALMLRRPMMLTLVDPVMDEFDRLFDTFWTGWETPGYSLHRFPTLDMHREKGELVVKAELPGIKPEEVEVNLNRGTLTVKAEKREHDPNNGYRSYRNYYRSVALPEDVDTEKVSATFDHGLLEIRFPETQQLETKRIEVKALAEPTEKAPKAKRTRKPRSPKPKAETAK